MAPEAAMPAPAVVLAAVRPVMEGWPQEAPVTAAMAVLAAVPAAQEPTVAMPRATAAERSRLT
jgi:hypothetical protein